MNTLPVLTVQNLCVGLRIENRFRSILDEIGFSIQPGSLTAIIGESGCGKSTLCKALPGLLDPKFTVSGSIELSNTDDSITTINLNDSRALAGIRGRRIGLLFQEPGLTLNPVLTVGRQICDILPNSDRAEALRLLETVGFSEPAQIFRMYAHELSGGQSQRVALALALAGQPRILIVDEPATALDSIARQEFFDLLRRLKAESGLAILMVTHDLHELAERADRIIVLYSGWVVEQGDSRSILEHPAHPYSKALLDIFSAFRKGLWPVSIPGEVADSKTDAGCRFAGRCDFAQPICRSETPPLLKSSDHRAVRCHFPLPH